VDPQSLVTAEASKDILPPHDKRLITMFHTVPIFGDGFLPHHPSDELNNKKVDVSMSVDKKRILTGATDYEGGVFMIFGQLDSHPFFKQLFASPDKSGWTSSLTTMLMAELPHINEKDAKLIVTKYLASGSTPDEWKKLMLDLLGDIYLLCPVLIQSADLIDNHQPNSLHNYLFSFKSRTINGPGIASLAGCPQDQGVCHAGELPFLFGRPLLSPEYFNDDDKEASRQMIDLIASFVRGDEIPWPQFKKGANGQRVTLEINHKKDVKTRLLSDYGITDRCNLLEKAIRTFPRFHHMK